MDDAATPRDFQERDRFCAERDLAFALLRLSPEDTVSVASLLPDLEGYASDDVARLLACAGFREGERLTDAQSDWAGRTSTRCLDCFSIYDISSVLSDLVRELRTASPAWFFLEKHPDLSMAVWRKRASFFREDWFSDNEPYFAKDDKIRPLSIAADMAVPDSRLFDGTWEASFGVSFGFFHLSCILPEAALLADGKGLFAAVAGEYAKLWFDAFFANLKAVDIDLWHHFNCRLEDDGLSADTLGPGRYAEAARDFIGIDDRIHGLLTSGLGGDKKLCFRIFIRGEAESDSLLVGIDTGKKRFPLFGAERFVSGLSSCVSSLRNSISAFQSSEAKQ